MALSVLNMPRACQRRTTTADHPTSRLLFVHSLGEVLCVVRYLPQSSSCSKTTLVILRVHLQNVLSLTHSPPTRVHTHPCGRTTFLCKNVFLFNLSLKTALLWYPLPVGLLRLTELPAVTRFMCCS